MSMRKAPGDRASTVVVKRKVCLVGESGVGKTSLIRRFVLNEFDDAYVATLGAVVRKKTVHLPGAEGPIQVDLVILDIIGRRSFMQLFRDAYFAGAAGVLAVFDLANRASLRALPIWVRGVRETVGDIPVVVVGNKADLTDRIVVSSSDFLDALGPSGLDVMRGSAKTGENVETAFLRLAGRIHTASERTHVSEDRIWG